MSDQDMPGDEFLQLGAAVLVRTVTFYWIGKLVSENDMFMTLNPAACIFDTGRFSDALNTGKLQEVEPLPAESGWATIGKGAIVDITAWNHPIPTEKVPLVRYG